ncbi:hypothetical protein BD410DRAFT_824878 [Rickenella mellea]|uniref:Methyltransferase domain-containing protein n=1 Tax=Rickenella mellea TaxID=50990 RepID=A0A4Y7QLN9_9AGAM|nr:hypothetical protein BD410DRAFT_824878 [Rickenella mellea]
MATIYSPPPVPLRSSLWFPPELSSSSSSSSPDTSDSEPHFRPHRNSLFTLRDKLYDFDRSVMTKLHKQRPAIVRRVTTGKLEGGKLKKSTSASLLSSFYRSPLDTPSPDIYLDVIDISPMPLESKGLSYDSWAPPDPDNMPIGIIEERKMTAVPATVVNGVGYGLQRTESDEEVDLSKGGYRNLPYFARRGHIAQVHPYSRLDAPYMQAYNRVGSDIEEHMHHLLRRLNSNGTPSFHDYGSEPPLTVLDLGCGHGFWAVDAAAAWQSAGTKITAFDLVDVVPEASKNVDNITWRRGNFVAYSLPFDDHSFDLVRLADLTLCIPYSRWETLLEEVRRVLTPGGRVEIIDDHLFFPYVSTSMNPPRKSPLVEHLNTSTTDGNSLPSAQSSISTSDTLVECEGNDDQSTLVDDHGNACHDEQTFPVIPPSRVDICHAVEQTFESMLHSSEIHTRPHDFLKVLLMRVFGRQGCARKIRSFHLSLPTPSSDSPQMCDKHGRTWAGSEMERVERLNEESLAEVQSKGKVNSKAAKLLGIVIPEHDTADASQPWESDSSLSSSSTLLSQSSANRLKTRPSLPRFTSSPTIVASSTAPRSQPYLPDGLILHPDIFVPMGRRELEMTVCKYIHVLIECKAALTEFVASRVDESISAEAMYLWEDYLGDYESFSRRRFNLTDSAFDDDDDDGYSTPHIKRSMSASTRHHGDSHAKRPESSGAYVRAIRVYEAYNVLDDGPPTP